MAEFISKIPGNLTEYPNAFKRQGAFPLEAYSVFTSVAEAETYAQTNPLAYVGQVIAVTYKTTETKEEQTITTEHARLYIIRTEAGELLELGSTDSLNEIWDVLNEWAPFFEDKDSLDKAYDTLKELQAYIDEHGDDFTALYADVRENRADIIHINSRWELNEDGITYKRDENGNRIPKEPTGVLPELIGHVDDLFKKTETRTEVDGEEQVTITYDGEIVDYIADAIPVATLTKLGRVKSSTEENFITVYNKEDHPDKEALWGKMEVNSLNVMKLTQTAGDVLLLDGGNASGIATN